MNKSNIAQDQIASLMAENMPKQILSFKFTEELQNRIQKLVNNKKEGKITLSESKELDKYLSYDLLIGLAKSKAHKS
jgi:uncharacterized iron-regulated protein